MSGRTGQRRGVTADKGGEGELEDTRTGEQEGAVSIPGEMGDLCMSLVVVLCAQTAALSGAPKYETESHATAMVLSTTDGARQPDVSQGQLIPALTPGIHPEKGYSSKVEKTQSFVIKLKIIVFSLQFQLRKYTMLVTQLYSFMSRLSCRYIGT